MTTRSARSRQTMKNELADIECLENDEIGDRYPVLITEENVSVIPDENDINRR